MSTRPALDVLRAEAHRLALPLDAVALDRFATYLDLLETWRGRAGLTAITDRDEVQRRHFGEALALLVVLRASSVLLPGATTRVVDLGSGAGFPGLPMRIADPGLQLTLIEANARRCRFLEAAVDALGLDQVAVVQARAEDVGRNPALRATFDLAVARALAPLAVLVEYALPLLRDRGVLAATKGSRVAEELVEARAAIVALDGTVDAVLPLAVTSGAAPQQVVIVKRSGMLDDRFPRRAGMPSRRPLR
jgi:16S rRNA (guanine527-N7)-methyltransferase